MNTWKAKYLSEYMKGQISKWIYVIMNVKMNIWKDEYLNEIWKNKNLNDNMLEWMSKWIHERMNIRMITRKNEY